jgi:hypothetical protein
MICSPALTNNALKSFPKNGTDGLSAPLERRRRCKNAQGRGHHAPRPTSTHVPSVSTNAGPHTQSLNIAGSADTVANNRAKKPVGNTCCLTPHGN